MSIKPLNLVATVPKAFVFVLFADHKLGQGFVASMSTEGGHINPYSLIFF